MQNSHGNTVRSETSSGGLILKPAKVILSTDIFKLSIILEGVNSALPLYGVSTLHIEMVRQEQFLGSMELPPPTH